MPNASEFQLLRLESTDSTNAHAKRLIASGVEPGLAILADAQTAGYGQKGREWASAPGAGMYLSVLLKPLSMPTWLPLLAALAAHDATTLFTSEARIKWVNDVVARGSKLGGILVEQVRGVAVVGIGLNVRTPLGVPDAIGLDALTDTFPSALELAEATLDALASRLAAWQSHGLEAVREPWLSRCAHVGREVVIEGIAGRVVGLGSSGELCLELPDGERRMFFSGTLRMANGTYCG